MIDEVQPQPVNEKLKLEALLTADYTHIIGHLPLGRPVDTSVISLLREEETKSTLEKMRKGPVVISGTSGVGKTSLLYQLLGVAKRENRPALLLSGERLSKETSKEMELDILSTAAVYGFEASNIADLVDMLKDKEAMLLVDELTLAFQEKGVRAECDHLVQLIDMVNKQGIPLALVIHQDQKILKAAQERFSFISEGSVIIPRDLTKEEVKTTMRFGAACEPDKEPKRPDVLVVRDEAVDTLIKLTGHKPICVNNFTYGLYREQRRNNCPASVITVELIEEYWKQQKHFLITDSAFQRLTCFAVRVVKATGQLETFMKTFGLPKWPNATHKIDEAIGRMTGEEEYTADVDSVSLETKDLWKNLGLIREENGKLAIDGLIPAICAARMTALMAA